MGWVVATTPGGTVVMLIDKACVEQGLETRIISGHRDQEEAWAKLQKERFERYGWKADLAARGGE